MQRILLLSTGGTIASKIDPQTHAAVPVTSGDGLVPPHVLGSISLDVRDVACIGGSQVTPELGWELAKQVQHALADPDYLGVIITQGTDGIEETAYLLDLLVSTSKPVVHTAAMRNQSELGADGPRNLASAVRVAASPLACDHGVLVVMNDKIFAAGEVMKTDTVNPDSFAAPGRGPLGVVARQGPVFFHRTLTRQHLSPTALETRIPIIRVGLGMDGALVEAAVKGGAQGIVLEGAGAGNIAERAVPAIERALAARIPVVMTSSAYQGLVDPVYGYPGGGYMLNQAGVILGQGLTAAKARVKLMVALGSGLNGPALKDWFEYLY